ncbi:MAG: metal-dependent hydrolase [Bradymonadia bacterium]
MDTITQAVLGAAVGQAVAGPTLGRKALVWGAIGGTIPDLDVIAGALVGPWQQLLWHRGPTHALWFGPVVGPLVGYAAWRYTGWRSRRFNTRFPNQPQREPGPLKAWIWLMILAILTHPLLDVFTTYGTQLLSPFDDTRFAFNGVGIIDPIYTLVLAGALVARRFWPDTQRRSALVALTLTTGYVLWGTWLNHRAESLAQTQLAEAGHGDVRVRAYPTIFQLFLRRVVAVPASGDDLQSGEVHVGYMTMWRPHPIAFKTVEPHRHAAVDAVLAHPHGELFRWFAMDMLLPTVTPGPAEGVPEGQVKVELDDLRYGFPETPRESMWGISALALDDGTLVDEPARFRRPTPPDMSGKAKAIFTMAFGDDLQPAAP